MTVLLALPALVACGEEDLGELNNNPPSADAGLNQSAFVGERVAFDGVASTDADGEIVRFEWSFGDEESAQGQTATHIYSAPGDYAVTLKVTDDLGATDVDEITVSVSDNEAPIVVIDAPIVAQVDQSVRFNGSASTDPDGTISSFTWDLGDGIERFGPEVDHAFDSVGSFLVTLTVVDDQGASATGEHEILVEEVPATFSGTWSWFLVDDTLRELPFPCGTFQDSTLVINANAPNISITEEAGAFSATYSGTLDDQGHFETLYSSFGTSQTIIGDFTSDTTFTGVYGLDPGFGDPCTEREVTGVKVSD